MADMKWDPFSADVWHISDQTEQLLELHHQCARTTSNPEQSFRLIAVHCEIVARLALLLANQSNTEPSHTLIVGALAHDIGTYSVLDEEHLGAGIEPIFQRDIYIQHGVRGYELLRNEGFSTELAAFARNHTGVGITREECVKSQLPLEPADYMPRTVYEELVMLADKFHTKSMPPRFVRTVTARARCEKFGAENLQRWDTLVACYGVPSEHDLAQLAEQYGMGII
ncbi:HD domain-containing protein [Alloscardovia omnicolens]|uniref:HD domain-containing protein n=1 Tax=Alloscardovia omnicolens TaxID=419015 RepID=UPI003A787473